jgi:hypothetical protein
MSTTAEEQRRFAQIVTDPVAYRSTDEDILANREAANRAFDDPAPRPRWLGYVSDGWLAVLFVGAVVLLCLAPFARALIEIVRMVKR